MTWGNEKDINFLVSVWEASGKPPEALKNKPYLDDPFLVEVTGAFAVLNQGRNIGFDGPLPIPLSEVLTYCEFKGIDDEDDLEEYVFYLRAMDSELLNFYREKKGNTNG